MGTPTALRQTRAYLTGTSFANNTTGAITAQMVRQFTESGMGGYACINNAAGDGTPAVQAIANATTVTQMYHKILEPYQQQLLEKMLILQMIRLESMTKDSTQLIAIYHLSRQQQLI